jgi:hypothetical protein
MATFGVKLKIDDKVLKYVGEANKRLGQDNFIKSPFEGKLALLYNNLCVVDITPKYPNFSYFGLLWVFTCVTLTNDFFTLWNIPGVLISIAGVFWSKYFFYWFIKKCIRRYGYKGEFKLLSNIKTIKGFINGTT